MQKSLLFEANLPLTKATEIACNIEAAETQAIQLKETCSTPVINVRSNKDQGHNTEKHGTCTCCGEHN